MKTRSGAYYYDHKRTRVKDVLEHLEHQQKQRSMASAEKINQILTQRRQKLKQIRSLRDSSIDQLPFKPQKKQQIFSSCSPISKGQKYLLEKYRTKLIQPDRQKSSRHNMKGGSVDISKMANLLSNNHPEIINRKFSQYIRIVDSQTGSAKKQRLNKQKNISNINMKMSMKLTLFKKNTANKFNFYKPPVHHISRVNCWGYEQNLRFSESDNLVRQYNTIDVAGTDSSNLQKSRNITQTAQISEALQKSRISKRNKFIKISRGYLLSGKSSNASLTQSIVKKRKNKVLDQSG